MMNPLVHDFLQTILNLVVGAIWGTSIVRLFPKGVLSVALPPATLPYGLYWLWATLAVFVSIRLVGDFLMRQPMGTPLEALNLYSYATAFYAGFSFAYARATRSH